MFDRGEWRCRYPQRRRRRRPRWSAPGGGRPVGHLYVKSDVSGFGVVMLEMLSGQRALDPSRPNGQLSLADWAKPYLADRRKLARLMDPRFEGQYNSKQAFQAAQLTLNCLAGEPRSRGGAGDAGAHRVDEEPGPGGPGRRQRRRRLVAGPPPRPHRRWAPPAVVAPRRRRASRLTLQVGWKPNYTHTIPFS